jgi:hypothetical protein
MVTVGEGKNRFSELVFILMLRLYWPKPTPPSILEGSWVLPAVKQAQK